MRRLAAISLATALAACQGVDRTVALNPDQSVAVTSVAAPVAVSAIDRPVTIAGVAQPVAISGVTQAVTVSTVMEPVTISSVAAPVRLVRPELDPDRIESGNGASGTETTCGLLHCTELVRGPFILTDLIVGNQNSATVHARAASGPPRWSSGSFSSNTTVTGARFAVRSGEVLLLESVIPTGVTWSGFRP